MKQIHASELSRWLSMPEEDRPLVLDVREPWEVAIASLPQALHIPMQQIPRRVEELNTGRPVVCVCHHGMRSMQVAIFLQRHGVDTVYNLVGGIHAWAREVDPNCPTY